ncbi:MAG: hypothetical protein GX089_12110 [Fibrobacter sp.]|nr:hypothetical protein [Fibrobacter sp.]
MNYQVLSAMVKLKYRKCDDPFGMDMEYVCISMPFEYTCCWTTALLREKSQLFRTVYMEK